MASSSSKVNIKLTGVPETAVYTLWIKAQESLQPDSKLHDKWAIDALNLIEDYDFSKFALGTPTTLVVPLRSKTFDKWTTSFLDSHDSATVVNLACGLESRALRVLPSYPKLRWVDVDLPDMVALRQQLLPSPDGDYTLLGASVTDHEWLKTIPADRPTLVLAEGLVMYLNEPDVHSLIRRLVDRFDSGQLIFDTVGSFSLPMQHLLDFLKNTNSSFAMGTDDHRAIEKLDPRIRLRQVVRHADYEGFHELPARLRVSFWVGWYIPWVRNLQAIARYDFGSVESKGPKEASRL